MKMNHDWLKRHYDDVYAGLRFTYGIPFGPVIIDVPDDWFIRINNEGLPSRSGSSMELTRKGWHNVRDEVRMMWGTLSKRSYTWDECDSYMKLLLDQQEQRFVDEIKRMETRCRALNDLIAKHSVFK